MFSTIARLHFRNVSHLFLFPFRKRSPLSCSLSYSRAPGWLHGNVSHFSWFPYFSIDFRNSPVFPNVPSNVCGYISEFSYPFRFPSSFL